MAFKFSSVWLLAWFARANVAFTVIALGSPAGAEVSAQKQEAQRKASAGAKLLDQNKPREALVLLEQAYALYPDARYQYDIGLAHRTLEHDAEALLAFQRFIADAQTKALPEHIADAVQQERALRRKLTEIQLASNEDGAQVLVDGQDRGHTPALATFFLGAGAHTLVVKKDGFVPFEQSIRAEAGAKKQVLVTLQAVATEVPAPSAPSPVALAPVALPPRPPVTVSAAPRHAAVERENAARPSYRRWWFWSAVGAVVAVSAAIVLGARGGSSPRDICREIPCI